MVLIAAASASWYVYAKPINDAEGWVKNELNDPASAVFDGLRHYPETGTVCGYANSKNRMVGYVGRTLFMASTGAVLFEPDAQIMGTDCPGFKAEQWPYYSLCP